jgi:hypothetical protein
MLDGEAGILLEEFLEGLPLVRGGMVQQNNDPAPEMAQQLPQKTTDLVLSDVVKKEEIIEGSGGAAWDSLKFLK